VKAVISVPAPLLEALRGLVPGAANRTLRQMLEQGRVRVNGAVVRLARAPVAAGDTIEVAGRAHQTADLHGIEIVLEDDQILVISKPVGLLTVATEHERERTVFSYLKAYARSSLPRRDVYVVHRIDKFASGLLVFAKSEPARESLRALFRKHDVERRYWAIVEGSVKKDTGTIRSRLVEDAALHMRSTLEPGEGKLAVTHFRVLRRFPALTTLEVQLETGRKNQIRVHLSEMGHPIAGDRPYGSTTDPLGRLGLHAFTLGFAHPATGERLQFRTEPPPEFRPYL
jgi:RluA family pseudouridine synthase